MEQSLKKVTISLLFFSFLDFEWMIGFFRQFEDTMKFLKDSEKVCYLLKNILTLLNIKTYGY